MEKYNANSVSVKSILKIIGFVFALVTFITMFVSQVKINDHNVAYEGHKMLAFFGDNLGYKGAWASFVGYLLVILAGVAGVVSIFLKDAGKLICLIGAAASVVGAVLIVLVKVMFVKINDLGSIGKIYTLASGPIVGCVFGGLTAICLRLAALVNDAE